MDNPIMKQAKIWRVFRYGCLTMRSDAAGSGVSSAHRAPHWNVARRAVV